jgi:hypothetical protein
MFAIITNAFVYNNNTKALINQWLKLVVNGSIDVCDVVVLDKYRLHTNLISVIVNRLSKRIYNTTRCNQETMTLQRLMTVFTVAKMATENSSTYRRCQTLIKNFSIDLLVNDSPASTIYMMVSHKSKHFYVGLTGQHSARAPSLRLREHFHGMRQTIANTDSKQSTDLFYTKAQRIGPHTFSMIPCTFTVDSKRELHRLESYWIRTLMPTLNTAKLPRPNKVVKKRNRPFPDARRDFSSPKRVDMSNMDKARIAKFHIVSTNDNNVDVQPNADLYKMLLEITKTTEKETSITKESVKRLLSTKIKMHAGNINLTSFTQLRRTFGDSIVYVDISAFATSYRRAMMSKGIENAGEMSLRLRHVMSRRQVKQEHHMMFKITKPVLTSAITSIYHTSLEKAAKHRHSMERTSIERHYSVHTLQKMWSTIRYLQPARLRDCATRIVTTGFKRHHLNPRPSSVLTMPFRDDMNLGGLRSIPDKIIDEAIQVHTSFKTMIKSELRPVFTRRESLGDMFLNTRKHAKQFDSDEEHRKCTCKQLAKFLNIDGDKHMHNGHIAIKAVQIPEHDNIPKELKMNMKTIPTPDPSNIRNEIETALNEWVQSITPWINVTQSQKRRPIEFHGDKYVSVFTKSLDKQPTIVIEQKRLERLYSEYMVVMNENRKLFRKNHGTTFIKDFLRMVRVHTRKIDSDHWINHPQIYERIAKTMGGDTEYFSSPLNFNLCHRHYFSEHSIDQLFGSKGNSWKHKWNRSGVANPIYKLKEIQRTIARAQEASTRYGSDIILTIPLWKKLGHVYHKFMSGTNIHVAAIWDEKQYAFHPPWSATYQRAWKKEPIHKAPTNIAFILVSAKTDVDEIVGNIRNDLKEVCPSMPYMNDETESDFSWQHFTNDHRIDTDTTDELLKLHLGSKTRKSWRLTSLKPRHNATINIIAEMLNIDYESMLKHTLEKCKRNSGNGQNPTPFTDLRQLRKFAKGLKEIAVVSELDKNASCALISCKEYYNNAMNKTFVNDPHYEVCEDLTPKLAIASMRKTFYENDWKRFGTFQTTPPKQKGDEPSFPYAYTLTKNKDLAKFRPIVSYCTHPTNVMLRRVARALKYMLETISAPHWTLWRTDNFTSTLKGIHKSFLDEGFQYTRALAGDIKQMYTELKHDSIMSAIVWLTSEFYRTTRRSEVTVPMHARHGAHKGMAYGPNFVTFTLKDIENIVEFDISNAYFKTGSQMLQQKIGIPMGSPISPMLAIVFCAFYECIHEVKQIHSSNKVRGSRYVDDAIFITGLHSLEPKEIEEADSRLRHVADKGYHVDLIVECDDNQHDIAMLESTVHWKDGQPCNEFWHKNRNSIINHGTQDFLKFQPFESYSSKSSKRGVIISTFVRMQAASSNDDMLLRPLTSVLKELKSLRYPKSIVTSAIETMKHRSPPDGWVDNCFVWGKALSLADDEWS